MKEILAILVSMAILFFVALGSQLSLPELNSQARALRLRRREHFLTTNQRTGSSEVKVKTEIRRFANHLAKIKRALGQKILPYVAAGVRELSLPVYTPQLSLFFSTLPDGPLVPPPKVRA